MTYRTYEDSVASGIPVELFDVYDEDGVHWRYCTGSELITYGGYSYGPDVINRGDIEIGGTSDRANVEIQLVRDNAFASQFVSGVIETTVSVDIYRQHVDQTSLIWSGYLVNIEFDDNFVPTCVFSPLGASSERMGVRRRCQRLCDHVLYSTPCGVSMVTYANSGMVDSISSDGLTITSTTFSSKANGWFLGGVIKVGTVYRFIIVHSTDTIQIDRAFSDLDVTDSFTAYAGCDLCADTCRDKFDNIYNFGGQEFLPVENPFEGDITE